MNVVRTMKVTLDQVVNSDSLNAAARHWVVPKKATILSHSSGTLIEADDGQLYLATVGDWFRSPFVSKSFPQVDQFNQLQDYGLTEIKDKLVRHSEKKIELKVEEKIRPRLEVKKLEKLDGQTIPSKNNVSVEKVNKAVESDIKSEKKD
jgi:hypothetical protein